MPPNPIPIRYILLSFSKGPDGFEAPNPHSITVEVTYSLFGFLFIQVW